MNNVKLVMDTLLFIQNDYINIVHINMDTEEFIEIKSSEHRSVNIKDWIHEFVKTGVHPDDVESYLEFSDVDRIRSHFSESDQKLTFRYRRKIENQYRWVAMTLAKSFDYSETNRTILLLIRDIHEELCDVLEHHKVLEKYSYSDELTGLNNRRAYSETIHTFCKRKVGVIYADLNGLKAINDNDGHESGDQYIKEFSDILKNDFRKSEPFRIGGDEFVVIMTDIDIQDFYKKVGSLISEAESKSISVSIGTSYTDNGNIRLSISDAENNMYINKSAFYKTSKMERRVTS